MSLRKRRKNRREDANLELTPLIDVVFLLLIFFLITTTFSEGQEDQLPIELPEAVSGQEASEDDEEIVLYITEDGSVRIKDDEPLEGDGIGEKLDDLYERHPESPIVLRGDQNASHGQVVDVLDRIKQTGFNQVNLVTSRPQSGD
ncbi:MAG: ExbD/TolR family protein [Persicimonas sp.]